MLGHVTVYDIIIMAIMPAKPNFCFKLDQKNKLENIFKKLKQLRLI